MSRENTVNFRRRTPQCQRRTEPEQPGSRYRQRDVVYDRHAEDAAIQNDDGGCHQPDPEQIDHAGRAEPAATEQDHGEPRRRLHAQGDGSRGVWQM